jgi:hypothetical protein
MLQELVPTRQISDEPPRRWFTGEQFDLIVWYDGDLEIIGFQLCYQKGSDEHALTWWRDKGFAHDRIDDGEGRPDEQKMTPILVPDGSFDRQALIEAFREQSRAIEPRLVRFVTRTIAAYPGGDE